MVKNIHPLLAKPLMLPSLHKQKFKLIIIGKVKNYGSRWNPIIVKLFETWESHLGKEKLPKCRTFQTQLENSRQIILGNYNIIIFKNFN